MGLCVGDMHGGQEMGDMVIFLKTGAVLQRGWSRSRNEWELPLISKDVISPILKVHSQI